MNQDIVDFDTDAGFSFQGDLSITLVPSDIKVDRNDEVAASQHRLVLMEGEATGHHHAIDLLERPAPRERVNAQVERLMSAASAGLIPLPTARLFRDVTVAQEMQKRGILTRTDLVIAVLLVETGDMVVRHDEHVGIRLPPGCYLIGGQVESVGAETRRIAD